jgi:hypothetical protein
VCPARSDPEADRAILRAWLEVRPDDGVALGD